MRITNQLSKQARADLELIRAELQTDSPDDQLLIKLFLGTKYNCSM